MRILISGSTGLIGSALLERLRQDGHELIRLVRSPLATDDPQAIWNIADGKMESGKLEDLDAVVHLAGENIASGRWTNEKKRAIRDSRVNGTRFLARTLAGLDRPPRAFLCASAVGFYGNRGDELLTEAAGPGVGLLADICREWEAAAEPVQEAAERVVHLRIGLVLSRRGGALKAMLPMFRMGLGGRLGSGRQWVSWISHEDLVEAIVHCIEDDDVRGPVNMAAPNPVRNEEFTKALAETVGRPAILPVPAFALRLAVGEMADALLLWGARMQPQRLLASGYEFRHPDLQQALAAELRNQPQMNSDQYR